MLVGEFIFFADLKIFRKKKKRKIINLKSSTSYYTEKANAEISRMKTSHAGNAWLLAQDLELGLICTKED